MEADPQLPSIYAGGVRVDINPEKPPRGVFSVELTSNFDDMDPLTTTIVTTAPGEARPFPKLKALDIEALARKVRAQAENDYLLQSLG